jgi:hypothetical protein
VLDRGHIWDRARSDIGLGQAEAQRNEHVATAS